jgi:single-stranded-DNA-specific exonuclease
MDNRITVTYQIVTKIVGVTYDNRQAVIGKLQVGEEVRLVRDPQNPFDANAIQVVNLNGQQCGFLSRDLAAKLADSFDRLGQPVKAIVLSLTGGYYIGSYLGANIRFPIPG